MSQNCAEQAPARYVVGYCFSPDMSAVALIEKLKPEWQKGKLNGVGGKVEAGETPQEAMAREFEEEAGVSIDPSSWYHFHTERFTAPQEHHRGQIPGAIVYHLAVLAYNAEWPKVRTMEKEKIFKLNFPLRDTDTCRLIYNLPYLIPMAAILLAQPPENRPAVI